MIRLGRGGQDRSAEAWYATNGHIVARKCGRKGLGAGYAPVTGLDARGGPVNRDENPCVPRTPLPRPQCSICCAPFNHRWSAHGLGLFVIAAICLLLLDWRLRLSLRCETIGNRCHRGLCVNCYKPSADLTGTFVRGKTVSNQEDLVRNVAEIITK